MIYSSDIETDDLVVEALSEGELRVKALHEKLTPKHKVTIQAVYNALNQLIDAGVVWKHGTKVGLSHEWAQKVSSKLIGAQQTPSLSDGESITYSFNSLVELDKYWKHLILLMHGVDPHYPAFLTTPHQMWAYVEGRSESEHEYIRSFGGSKRYGYYVLGGTTQFDKEYRMKYAGEYLQIELLPQLLKKRESHYSVFGDYILDTILSSDVAQEIDEVYENSISEEDLSKKLQPILSKKQRTKIRLTKNMARAKALRKKLSKPFYIPRELREKYELF